MATQTGWAGTASDLLDVLGRVAGDGATRAKGWPRAPQALSGRLRRAATLLRKSGIEIHYERKGHGRTRTIHITRVAPDKKGTRSSSSSAEAQKAKEANGFTVKGADDRTARTQNYPLLRWERLKDALKAGAPTHSKSLLRRRDTIRSFTVTPQVQPPGDATANGPRHTNGLHPKTKSGANINREKSKPTKKVMHMRKIQNTNISFRVTTDLKQRLADYCLENDLHNSNVIRYALNSYLRQETKAKCNANGGPIGLGRLRSFGNGVSRSSRR